VCIYLRETFAKVYFDVFALCVRARALRVVFVHRKSNQITAPFFRFGPLFFDFFFVVLDVVSDDSDLLLVLTSLTSAEQETTKIFHTTSSMFSLTVRY